MYSAARVVLSPVCCCRCQQCSLQSIWTTEIISFTRNLAWFHLSLIFSVWKLANRKGVGRTRDSSAIIAQSRRGFIEECGWRRSGSQRDQNPIERLRRLLEWHCEASHQQNTPGKWKRTSAELQLFVVFLLLLRTIPPPPPLGGGGGGGPRNLRKKGPPVHLG